MVPAREELPSTLRRSPKQAQETWIKAPDSAMKAYGEGKRSDRTAYAALHSFAKVGDRWETNKGPSDPPGNAIRAEFPERAQDGWGR
jgi:ChaB